MRQAIVDFIRERTGEAPENLAALCMEAGYTKREITRAIRDNDNYGDAAVIATWLDTRYPGLDWDTPHTTPPGTPRRSTFKL